jgi:hypothetical protein
MRPLSVNIGYASPSIASTTRILRMTRQQTCSTQRAAKPEINHEETLTMNTILRAAIGTAALAATLCALSAAPSFADNNWRDARQDRHDIRMDRKDIRFDRRDIRVDVRQGKWGGVRKDVRDIRHDRQDIRHDRRDLRNDR